MEWGIQVDGLGYLGDDRPIQQEEVEYVVFDFGFMSRLPSLISQMGASSKGEIYLLKGRDNAMVEEIEPISVGFW